VQEQGWNLYSTYCDDGVFGTTFDRPGFNQLIADATALNVEQVPTPTTFYYMRQGKPNIRKDGDFKVWNDPSEWVFFENTQEPIIEESVFLVVQNIRQGRRRPTKMGDMGMFSGLVYCANCGGKIYLCRANHFKPEQEYYICST